MAHSMKILIVDDHATNLKLLRAQLEAEGHNVLEAGDGAQALAVLEREPVDGIVSDILMPHMDGYSLCRTIRQHQKFSALPLILYTSTYDSNSDRQLAETVGADGYIIKPAATAVIVEALHVAMQKAGERTPPQSPPPGEAHVLKQYSEVLVHKLEEKNTELQETLENLRLAHEEIVELNRDLEQRVQGRTVELAQANEASHAEVAERKQAEAALKNNEERLGLALDSGEMGAWDLDLVHDTAIRTLKHDQIFGYQSLQPQWGAEIFMGHVFPEDREVVRKKFDEAFATDHLQMECRIIWKDQSLHWIAAHGLVYRDQEGTPLRMLGVVMDITERKEAEAKITQLNADLQQGAAQIEEANKELESFSYSVSHDLRAPLRHVHGYVEMLQREARGQLSDKAQRHLKTIAEASSEMGDLIDDLLAFSRTGRAEMSESRVHLNELAQDAIRVLEPATTGRTIVWQIPPLAPVVGDPSLLKQVLANLIGNAVKYSRMRDPAAIEIGCAGEEDGRVILFVRDNGAGFDMQYAHKLFGVFQRLHRAEEFEGTGIGLAIVRRIVGRHGGRVWAEGAVNEGATFYFTLKPSTP